MRVGLVLAAVLTVTPWWATADDDTPDRYFPQQMTAKELLRACASSSLTKRGRERQRYCHGFVSGVEEGVRLAQSRHRSDRSLALCVPPARTAREFADVYMRFAGRKGVDLDKPAALVVVEALRDAYACPDVSLDKTN